MADETRNATTLQAAGSWATEANFTGAHDGSCMTETVANDVSGEFSFNFSEVSGTVNGIEVMVHCIAGDTDDVVIVELKDSTAAWRLKTTTAPGSGSACGDCVDKTVGGSVDLWGGTFTDTHIKSTDFRIRLTADATAKGGGYWAADYCTVKVYYTAGVIDKDMADTGAGSEVFAKVVTLQAKAFVDVGAGADVLTNTYRAMGFTDSGAGADSFFLLAEKGFVDAGAGSDVFSKAITLLGKAFVDAGSAAEVFTTPYREMEFIDVGAGSDVMYLTRFLDFSDVGAGAEIFEKAIVGGAIDKYVVDTGSGLEVFAHIQLMDFTDAGAGLDIFLVTKPEIIVKISDGDLTQVGITDAELSQILITDGALEQVKITEESI